MQPRRQPFTCPVCGEEVSPNAKSCLECGACDKSGWRSDASADGLDLEDDAFDYDKFVAEEFGGNSPKPPGMSWLWWMVAIVLLAAFALLVFAR